MADELKYKVSIETEAVEASDLIAPSAIQALVELNAEIEDYRKQLSQLKAVEKEQGELTAEQAELQERLKGRIKETSTEYNRQQRELVKMQTATKAVGGSYNDLVKQNAALSAAMRALPLDDTTGELQKLQAQYNANNERLKEFDKAMGNHQRNVGNYSSALDNLGGMLSSIPGPIGDIVRTFEQFSKVLQASGVSMATKTTVIRGFTDAENAATVATAANTTAQAGQATSVQASAAAIGFDTQATVANTAATAGNTTATAANAASQTAQAAGATTAAAATGTLTVAQRALNLVMKANPVLLVVAAVAALASAFRGLQPVMDQVKLVTTAVSSAFQFLRDTVFRFIMGEEALQATFMESIRLSIELERATQRLRDARNEQVVASAQARQMIEQARLDAKDETLTIEERIKALQRAIDLEEINTARQIQLAEQQLMIERQKVDQYKSTADELEALANLEAEYINIGTQSLVRQRELREQLNTLERTLRAEEKARIDQATREQQEATREFERQLTQRRLALAAYRDAVASDTESIEQSIRKSDEAYIQGLADLPALDLDTSRDEAVLAQAFALGEELAAQTVDQAIRLGDTLQALELRQAEELRQRKLLYLSLNYTDQEAAQMALTDLTLRFAQERADAEVEIERQKSAMITETVTNLGNTITGIGTAIFGKNKAIAIAQAIIDTYAAANSALKSTPGGPLVKGLAVAAVIAKGLANVRTISQTQIGSSSMSVRGADAGAATFTRETIMQGVGANMGQVLATNTSNNIGAFVGRPIDGQDREIRIEANVNRRGLAIAVREGEQEIRTEQFAYV